MPNYKFSKTNLYIKGLAKNTTDKDLYDLCSRFGEILSTKAIIDKDTNSCKGFGFVDFAQSDSAQRALEGLTIKGMQVQMAKMQSLDSTNLYIANLPPTFQEGDLEKLICPFGKILSLRILRDNTLPSISTKGVGFARLETKSNCEKVIDNLNGKILEGSLIPLLCKFADNTPAGAFNHPKNLLLPSGFKYSFGPESLDPQGLNFFQNNISYNNAIPYRNNIDLRQYASLQHHRVNPFNVQDDNQHSAITPQYGGINEGSFFLTPSQLKSGDGNIAPFNHQNSLSSSFLMARNTTQLAPLPINPQLFGQNVSFIAQDQNGNSYLYYYPMNVPSPAVNSSGPTFSYSNYGNPYPQFPPPFAPNVGSPIPIATNVTRLPFSLRYPSKRSNNPKRPNIIDQSSFIPSYPPQQYPPVLPTSRNIVNQENLVIKDLAAHKNYFINNNNNDKNKSFITHGQRLTFKQDGKKASSLPAVLGGSNSSNIFIKNRETCKLNCYTHTKTPSIRDSIKLTHPSFTDINITTPAFERLTLSSKSYYNSSTSLPLPLTSNESYDNPLVTTIFISPNPLSIQEPSSNEESGIVDTLNVDANNLVNTPSSTSSSETTRCDLTPSETGVIIARTNNINQEPRNDS